MPDIINGYIRIRNCIAENNWQGLSLIDTNNESSYRIWSIKKWKWLKKW